MSNFLLQLEISFVITACSNCSHSHLHEILCMEYCYEVHIIKKSFSLISLNESNTELVGSFSVRLFGNFLWLQVVFLLHGCTVRTAVRVILFRGVCCSSFSSKVISCGLLANISPCHVLSDTTVLIMNWRIQLHQP